MTRSENWDKKEKLGDNPKIIINCIHCHKPVNEEGHYFIGDGKIQICTNGPKMKNYFKFINLYDEFE